MLLASGCDCATDVPPGDCVADSDCDDGLWCTGIEYCTGICVAGVPPDCDDGVDCTRDFCTEGPAASECASLPDHDLCEGGELCDPVSGCTLGPACAADAECDDAVYCNGLEWCGGVCVPGPAPACDDGLPCTVDACDWVAGACTSAPDDAACQDPFACNGFERCDPELDCTPGAPIGCPGGTCVEPLGTCATGSCDADGDGYFAAGDCGGDDCDDAISFVHPGAAELCDTTQDVDCDGHRRCFDPDCFGEGACPAAGCAATGCAAGRMVSPYPPDDLCGTYGGTEPPLNDLSTTDPESTEGLGCLCGFAGYDGRAMIFELPPPPEGNRIPNVWLRVYVEELTADLDLFVLYADPIGACNPEPCVDYSISPGTTPETVYVTMDRAVLPDPAILYVVVAEAGASSSSFDLWMCQWGKVWTVGGS